MEGIDHRGLYPDDDYRSELLYAATADNPGIDLRVVDRPRPASARDLTYLDMFDSGIHHTHHSSSPRINQQHQQQQQQQQHHQQQHQQYADSNPTGGMPVLNSRTGSLDRRSELYGTLRGNVDSGTFRVNKPINRTHYAMQSLNSNPGLAATLGSAGYQQRRAHSYDMNLEKQGLSEYNSLLAAAGIGATYAGLYGNPTTQLLDYSGLTAPTLSSMGGGMDYAAAASLQRGGGGGFPGGAMIGTQPGAMGGFLNLTAAPDVATLHRECLRLQHELQVTREKLNACTTSIRTFWSPELKRERAMRKEENAKYAILADHLHNLQVEKQVGSFFLPVVRHDL